MRGGHQGDSGSDADPVADADVAALRQLLDDDEIVGDVHVASDRETAEPQQPDAPTREEGVPGPPLQDLLPKTPGEAHALSQVAVEARAEPGGAEPGGETTRHPSPPSSRDRDGPH